MGIISNIIDLVKGAKAGVGSFNPSDFTFRTTRNSISRKSSNSILQFPVICSNALSVDDLMMVSKALEREYGQFIRIAASLDDVIDANNPDAKLNKIRSLHQNMGYMGQGRIGMSGGRMFAESADDMKYSAICESFERKNIELLQVAKSDLNMTSLYEMTSINNKNYYNLGEASIPTGDDYKRAMDEMKYKQLNASLSRSKQEELDRIEDRQRVFDRQRTQDALSQAKFDMDRAKELRDANMAATQIVQNKSMFQNQLLATDVKKANELIPTMMELSFLYNNGTNMTETQIIIGVKTVNHLVTSDDMMHNIALAVKEKRHLFKFIQWTTGEIEMVKDWILAKDKIKDEVKRQRSGRESVWWRRLKGRSAEDKLRRFTFNNKDVLPNSTLVLTMDEVEMIINNHNINILKDARAVKSIFDTFFLLGLVIVDPAAELAYFNFDGQSDFQIQSFRSLEKENSSSADMKSLISLVDKNKR